MKAKNLKPMIISALLAVGFGATTVGTSFALFTDHAETSISVTSGKVDVNLTVNNPVLYSADATLTSGDLAGAISTGPHAGTYYFRETTGTFLNGGTAAVTNNTLVLNKVTPGDKVKTSIDVANESNVAIKYRVRFGCEEGLILFSALKFNVGTETLTNVKAYESEWVVADFTAKNIPISVELPLDAGNEYQGLSTKVYYQIEAVQANAATPSGSHIEEINLTSAKQQVETSTTGTSTTANAATFTVVENEAESNEKTTKVELQNDWYVCENNEDNLDVVLAVETYDESTATTAAENNSFVTRSGTAVVAGLNLNLSVNGETVTTFNSTRTKITSTIEPGLTNVKVYYAGVQLGTTDEGNNDYYTYDSATGTLTIYTTHFSEWYVTADMRDWEDIAAEEYSEKDTENKVIKIATNKELALLSKEINTTSGIYNGWTVKLTADIDLNGRRWKPMGHSMDNGKAFAPHFDGCGHTIKNMHCYEDDGYGIGFIGDVRNQNKIKNVTFDNVVVAHQVYTQGYYGQGNIIGIVAGYAYGNVWFENVHVKNSIVSGYGKVGGILGMAADAGGLTSFNNCSVENTTVYGIYNMAYFAGLVQNHVEFTSCSFSGNKFNTFSNVVTLPENSVTDRGIDLSGNTYWKYSDDIYFTKYSNYCNMYIWNKAIAEDRLNNIDLDSWGVNTLEFLAQYEDLMFASSLS